MKKFSFTSFEPVFKKVERLLLNSSYLSAPVKSINHRHSGSEASISTNHAAIASSSNLLSKKVFYQLIIGYCVLFLIAFWGFPKLFHKVTRPATQIATVDVPKETDTKRTSADDKKVETDTKETTVDDKKVETDTKETTVDDKKAAIEVLTPPVNPKTTVTHPKTNAGLESKGTAISKTVEDAIVKINAGKWNTKNITTDEQGVSQLEELKDFFSGEGSAETVFETVFNPKAMVEILDSNGNLVKTENAKSYLEHFDKNSANVPISCIFDQENKIQMVQITVQPKKAKK
jgi:hypothetical protein